jgi:hypothetical protein
VYVHWGSHALSRHLGADGERYCTTCGAEREHYLQVDYRVHYIMILCRWVTEVQYASYCADCDRRIPVYPEYVTSELGGSQVPWLDRYGWLACIIFSIVINIWDHILAPLVAARAPL